MAPSQQVFTTSETLAVLAEKAKIADDFVVKVMRKGATGPIMMANLAGANLQHFISPELWIPQLCGGGKYNLMIYHSGAAEQSEHGKPVGGLLSFDIQEAARDVDLSAVEKAGWRGPAKLEFPTRVERAPQEQLLAYQSPPGPESHGLSATINNQPWARQPGGGVNRQQYGNPDSVDGNWRRDVGLIEAERRKLEEDKLSAERERARERQDAANKAHESEMRAMRAEFDAKLASSSARSGPDPVSTLLMEMMKQGAEDRRVAVAQAADDRRAEAARQERAETRAAEERRSADARFLAMMEKLNDKPKENPMEMFKLMNDLVAGQTKKNDGIVEAQTKMMHSMSEMMGQQVGVAMDFVSAAADMQLGQQAEKEPGWVKGLDGIVKAVGAMAKGASLRQPPPVPMPPQAVPQQLAPPAPGAAAAPVAPTPAPPVIVQIEMAIRQKFPPAQIAKVLVDNFDDASIQEALIECRGEFETYVQQKLGGWVNEDPRNADYLKQLFAAIEKALIVAGKIDEPEEEDAQIEGENWTAKESSSSDDEETP